MPSESRSVVLAGSDADTAVADRRKILPKPGDKAPCAGYWQPQCKKEEARHLRENEIVPVCRKRHSKEAWNLLVPGPDGDYRRR